VVVGVNEGTGGGGGGRLAPLFVMLLLALSFAGRARRSSRARQQVKASAY